MMDMWLGCITVSLLEMPSSVPMLTIPRYALRQAGEDHPDVQGRLGCTRLVMAPQPPSDKNGTLQSDARGHSRRTISALRASAAQAFWC